MDRSGRQNDMVGHDAVIKPAAVSNLDVVPQDRVAQLRSGIDPEACVRVESRAGGRERARRADLVRDGADVPEGRIGYKPGDTSGTLGDQAIVGVAD